jgi:hypothetical protein
MMLPTTSIQSNPDFGNRFAHTMYWLEVYRTRAALPGKVGSQVVYEPPCAYAVMFRFAHGSFYSCHRDYVARNQDDGDQLVSRHETFDEAHNAATYYARTRAELDAAERAAESEVSEAANAA